MNSFFAKVNLQIVNIGKVLTVISNEINTKWTHHTITYPQDWQNNEITTIARIKMDMQLQKDYIADRRVNFERSFENSLALSSKFKERKTWCLVILFLIICPRDLHIGIRMYVQPETQQPGNSSWTWMMLSKWNK